MSTEASPITTKASHSSMTSTSTGISTSPDSWITDDIMPGQQSRSSLSIGPESEVNHLPDFPAAPKSNGVTQNGSLHGVAHHVIVLSSIEHCMPRAYIRVCLAYSLPTHANLDTIVGKLNSFVRRLVDSKPYLAGYVVPSSTAGVRSNVVEIQFTNEEFLNYPHVQVRHLTPNEVRPSYSELHDGGLPPSYIRPELVSALPEAADDPRAPVFRMQANVIDGGLIVSVYLHHCISDGVGMGLLLTGKVLADDFTFKRHLEGHIPDFQDRLAAWASHSCFARKALSWSSGNQINDRVIKYKSMSQAKETNSMTKAPGCGTIFVFSKDQLDNLEQILKEKASGTFISPHDALQALLWLHMTLARISTLSDSIQTSKLFIPVNIRNKVQHIPHADSYFGAAVDFACAQSELSELCNMHIDWATKCARIAVSVRQAIQRVDESYIRQMIALANKDDPDVDVRDVMASNMARATGADMYITSWEKLELYDATLDMDIGQPDWVRKPWSKDPGSCVVLPRDERKSCVEVLIQMTDADMRRLLQDEHFMKHVERTIDAPS